ncbi:NAD+ kinase [Salpingoeca rosetta]|uniref:Fucosyltransferase n=1 Tax=Salpingoeca rosetta (strain ATCC 50818 / BSB-021) TaxID=946362 RepID=F2UND4_SALR5|nr:NAD+ kinase [Salpingoeca rosetta]EGD79139.1 NAD+ kinase [Salpingoeca rosetta]|eukprot:XP_004989224.1 NAD+ kinase [Salpingoeca rosetta]
MQQGRAVAGLRWWRARTNAPPTIIRNTHRRQFVSLAQRSKHRHWWRRRMSTGSEGKRDSATAPTSAATQPGNKPPRLFRPHFVASNAPAAQEALMALKLRYKQHALPIRKQPETTGSRIPVVGAKNNGNSNSNGNGRDTGAALPIGAAATSDDATAGEGTADVVVALGGDGFLLSQLHGHAMSGLPVFGMNRGTIGFLMNEYLEEMLMERLHAAVCRTIHPLRLRTVDVHGQVTHSLAFNEVSVFRQTRQAAHVCVSIDGTVRINPLISDGILVATPAGSTAYNASAGGIMLPLDSGLLTLTPICAFRPRRLRGGVLHRHARVAIENLSPAKRPISATADFHEVRDVVHVEVEEARDISLHLLYDPALDIDEKVWHEQAGSQYLIKGPSWEKACPDIAPQCKMVESAKREGLKPDAVIGYNPDASITIFATREALRKTPPSDKFTSVASYHPDADIDISWGRTLKTPTAWSVMSILAKYPYEKRTCDGIWVVSNMAISKRNHLAKVLSNHLKCVRVFSNGCSKLSHDIDCRPGLQRDPDVEFNEMAKYKFYFAFENARSDYYITEKVWRSLAIGNIPIVFGAPQRMLRQKLPPNSFISTDQFDSEEQLAAHVAKVASNKTLFESYHAWRKHYAVQYFRFDIPPALNAEGQYPKFGPPHLGCRLCRYVVDNHDKHLPKLSGSEIAAKVGDVLIDYFNNQQGHTPHRPGSVVHEPHISTSPAPSATGQAGGGGLDGEHEDNGRSQGHDSTAATATDGDNDEDGGRDGPGSCSGGACGALREEMEAELSRMRDLVSLHALKINQLELQIMQLKQHKQQQEDGKAGV